jgi:hypothetical protein
MDFEMFQHVMKTGVIYATSRARGRGFDPEDPDWANMGQGAPETGPLPGAPPRDFSMSIEDSLIEYAPVTVCNDCYLIFYLHYLMYKIRTA